MGSTHGVSQIINDVQNLINNHNGISEHIGIIEPQDTNPKLLDIGLSPCVSIFRAIAKMRISIKLDRQSKFGTVEVQNKSPDAILPPESRSPDAFAAQILP